MSLMGLRSAAALATENLHSCALTKISVVMGHFQDTAVDLSAMGVRVISQTWTRQPVTRRGVL
jgi:hypothetical protein